MRAYELWLDESGDFEPESQTRSAFYPSLVGGVLIEKGRISDEQIRRLAMPAPDSRPPHAMDMRRNEILKIVLPALETLCSLGGKLVYFENRERLSHLPNRELYHRILAAGLTQLVQYLSAAGPFSLDITVAIRYAPDDSGRLKRITPEEYRKELTAFVRQAYEEAGFRLSPESRVYLSVLSARKESRLFLADFACNSRITRDSSKFNAGMRRRLETLFDDRFIFPVTARTSESYILSRLDAGDVSSALLELYTGHGKIHHEKMFQRALERLESLSYRLARLQIQRFTAAVRAFAGKETDFERTEAVIKRILQEFFGELNRRGFPVQTDESVFWLYLSLADMYLREGDVIRAGPVMREMEQVVRGMNYRVENLKCLYFFNDKKALYEINRMEYEDAVKTIEKTIRVLEDAIQLAEQNDILHQYFANTMPPASEYLGNAYCMKIYAELFLQRQDAALYEKSLRADTEKALSQYRFPGELERNLQYRAHAEMERGECEQALEWLLKTRGIPLSSGSLQRSCEAYLTAAGNEDRLSKAYYLMYYVEIMEKSAVMGLMDFAAEMHKALIHEGEIMREILLEQPPETDIISDTGQIPVIYDDIFLDPSQHVVRRYHPQEIVFWKYGTYLYVTDRRRSAEEYWNSALAVCDENPDYTLMLLVSLAVQLERCSRRMKDSGEWKPATTDLRERVSRVLKTPELPPRMRDYACEIQSFLRRAVDTSTDGPDTGAAELAYQLSRRIAF